MSISFLLLLAGCPTPPDGTAIDTDAIYADGFADGKDEMEDEVVALRADVSALQTAVADLQARLPDGDGDLASSEDVTDCLDRVSTIEAEAVRVLGADTRWALSESDGPDAILATLAMLDGYRIPSGVTATIDIGAGAYTFDEPLRIEHPDGARIVIEGAGVDTTTFVFAGVSGLVLDDNQALGELSGVTLQGTGTGTGVTAARGALARLGYVTITGFKEGIEVYAGGTVAHSDRIWALGEGARTGSLRVTGNEGYGLLAVTGANVWLDGALFSGNDDRVSLNIGTAAYLRDASFLSSGNDGLLAEVGSVADVTGAAVSGNPGKGLWASNASVIDARSVEVDGGGAYGILAEAHSTIDAGSSRVTGLGDGILAHSGSFIEVSGAAASNSLRDGLAAEYASVLFADTGGASATDNGDEGAESYYGSLVFLPSSAFTGNGDNDLAVQYGSSAYVDGSTLESAPQTDTGWYSFVVGP